MLSTAGLSSQENSQLNEGKLSFHSSQRFTDASPTLQAPSALTSAPTPSPDPAPTTSGPAAPDAIKASIIRAISVVDKTTVYTQAAIGRASASLDAYNTSISSIQTLKDLYEKDNLKTVGIHFNRSDSA